MRIQQGMDTSRMYQAGETQNNAKTEENGKAGNGSKTVNKQDGQLTIQGSALNLAQNSIADRKAKAKAQAMDVILSQFGSDGEIDEGLEERRHKIADHKDTASEAQQQLNALTAQKKQMQEDLGIADDSQEQQDLELRIKVKKAMKPGSNVELSSEEWERYQKLGPATDYQNQMMEYEKMEGEWVSQRDKAIRDASAEAKIIRGMELELLKYHGMDDAVRTADSIAEAASKEIIGMAVQEGMDKVAEDIEEVVEKAEEKKEEREEAEALREEQKAEQQEQTQKMDHLPELEKIQGEVEARIQEILAKQKLLEEDLKGIQVDHVG